jgi:hypothetical protein
MITLNYFTIGLAYKVLAFRDGKSRSLQVAKSFDSKQKLTDEGPVCPFCGIAKSHPLVKKIKKNSG